MLHLLVVSLGTLFYFFDPCVRIIPAQTRNYPERYVIPGHVPKYFVHADIKFAISIFLASIF